MEKIESMWKGVDWQRVPLELKDMTLDTLKIDDESAEVLEEHQLLIQNIASSKFMSYFEEKVVHWQKGLSAVNDTVSSLAEVQKTWSFLINLFIYSEEVKKELPDESEEFVGIDREVKKILKSVNEHPNIVDFCTVQDENSMTVIKRLELVEKDLAKCQKGLNDF